MATVTSEWPKERLFDPELYGNGNPETYGLPLELYARLRDDHPCFKLSLDHPMLIDEESVRLAGEVSYVMDNYTRGIYSLPVTVEPA